jgi:hypothetical protein
MRKVIFAASGVLALVAAAVAVAQGIDGAKTARALSGSFAATSSNVSSRTCTTNDGKTLTITNGRYTGTASGDPDLTGPITLRARSVVNSDGVGIVDGAFKIDVSGGDTSGAFTTVYDHGTIAGLALGRAHTPSARLVANVSATFAPGSFTGGKLGGGTSAGSAVEIGPGKCASAAHTSEKSDAHGTITALSSGSITVAGLTCTIPSAISAEVNAKFHQNDRAEIRCSVQNGQNTLLKIEKIH